jgi:hypothetical protein
MKKEQFIQALFIFLIFICAAPVLAQPANDKYQNAVVTILPEPLIEIEGTNFGATKEPGEPNHANNLGGRSVWYRIVPQETTVVKIWIEHTSGADFMNTLLAVYKGTDPSEFNLVAHNDDMRNTTLSKVQLTVRPGNMYYVAVDGFNDNGNIAAGNFRIRFEKLGAPANDAMIDAWNPDARLAMAPSGFTAGTNRNATKEPGEPNVTNNPGGKSVWYFWRAPASRSMTVKVTCNPFVQECFDMQLGVFSAENVKVAANDNYDNNDQTAGVTFFAEEDVTYGFVVDGIKAPNGVVGEGNFFLDFYPTAFRYDSNFDATDLKADLSVFRPAEGTWYSMHSSNGQTNIVNFGANGDVPVPSDYDGDGVTDYAVVRTSPQGKTWYLLNSSNNSFQAVPYGLPQDKVLTGDYDGDGRADLVAVRAAGQNLVWYIRPSSSPEDVWTQLFGLSSDQPVTGNFVTGLDTVGGLYASDLAVVRSEPNGKKTWHIKDIHGFNYKQIQFGLASDLNVPADYDRDGYTDIGVWRPSNGTWYMFDESQNKVTIKQWGMSGDIPVPAQYDNSGSPELAVFRPSTGVWWIYTNAGAGTTSAVKWGISGDRPVSALTPLMNP